MDEVSAEAFEVPAAPPPLAAGEIHLWRLHLPEAGRHGLRARAHRQLGGLLAHYLGGAQPPALARGPHGKPYLPEHPGFAFNLSHGGDCALLAFALGGALGVDVEPLARRRPTRALARRYYAAAENDVLERLDDDAHTHAFLRLWTAKEAVLKAIGQGLSFGLDRVRFALDADGCIGTLEAIDGEGGDDAQSSWHVLALAPCAGHVGALAWQGADARVRAFACGDE